jgi:hypothetical protein
MRTAEPRARTSGPLTLTETVVEATKQRLPAPATERDAALEATPRIASWCRAQCVASCPPGRPAGLAGQVLTTPA